MSKKKKILITGATGMLGKDLVAEFGNDFDVIPASTEQFDITDEQQTLDFIISNKPDLIIHTVAYKDVDGCQKDFPKAYEVNIRGAEYVADAALETDAVMVLISTDYVFDGTKPEPYIESEETNPVNFYGNTKDRAEAYLRHLLDKHFIVRTAWLFGHHGDSFVTSMLKLAGEKDELNIVNDKYSTPTSTVDLSKQIRKLVDTDHYGTFHCSSQGECSWYEYALKIFELAGVKIKVNPIPMKDFPFKAERPPYSVLDNANLRKNGIDIMPDWEESLERFVKELKG